MRLQLRERRCECHCMQRGHELPLSAFIPAFPPLETASPFAIEFSIFTFVQIPPTPPIGFLFWNKMSMPSAVRYTAVATPYSSCTISVRNTNMLGSLNLPFYSLRQSASEGMSQQAAFRVSRAAFHLNRDSVLHDLYGASHATEPSWCSTNSTQLDPNNTFLHSSGRLIRDAGGSRCALLKMRLMRPHLLGCLIYIYSVLWDFVVV